MSGEELAVRSPTVFQSAEVLGGIYEIRGLLGAGGMGQVFEAHDHALNRAVAIKACWPEIASAAPGLLRREAQGLAAIQHHGLATVFSMGVHAGNDFLVMELIRGVSLEVVVQQQMRAGALLPLQEVLRILLAIADALSAVHAAACVHRDVKPGNVILAGGERVVLADFGLFLPEGRLVEELTVAGSPGYMAPEAIENRVRPGVGHMVDLYALGVVAFSLLSGRLPFEAKTVEELFDLHRHAPVPDLRALQSRVPPRLAALVRELLAKDPYDRPESQEVVARVREIREAEQEEESAARRPLWVLIVSDDRASAGALRKLSSELVERVEVMEASTVESALRRVRQKWPDLALLELPELSAGTLLAHMAAINPTGRCTAALFVDYVGQDAKHKRLRGLGVTDFVERGADLKSRLSEIMGRVRVGTNPSAATSARQLQAGIERWGVR